MKMRSYSNIGIIKVRVGSSDIFLSHPPSVRPLINSIYALALERCWHLIFIYFYFFHEVQEGGGQSCQLCSWGSRSREGWRSLKVETGVFLRKCWCCLRTQGPRAPRAAPVLLPGWGQAAGGNSRSPARGERPRGALAALPPLRVQAEPYQSWPGREGLELRVRGLQGMLVAQGPDTHGPEHPHAVSDVLGACWVCRAGERLATRCGPRGAEQDSALVSLW